MGSMEHVEQVQKIVGEEGDEFLSQIDFDRIISQGFDFDFDLGDYSCYVPPPPDSAPLSLPSCTFQENHHPQTASPSSWICDIEQMLMKDDFGGEEIDLVLVDDKEKEKSSSQEQEEPDLCLDFFDGLLVDNASGTGSDGGLIVNQSLEVEGEDKDVSNDNDTCCNLSSNEDDLSPVDHFCTNIPVPVPTFNEEIITASSENNSISVSNSNSNSNSNSDVSDHFQEKKKRASHDQKNDNPDADDNENDDPLTKKRKRQIRNRDAALRSRERKKFYVKDLELKSKYFEGECIRLQHLLQCCIAENHALHLHITNNKTAKAFVDASKSKQESAVLLLESLLLGSLLWFLGIKGLCLLLLLLHPMFQVALLANVGSNNQRVADLAPLKGAGSEKKIGLGLLRLFFKSKRCRATRSKMKSCPISVQFLHEISPCWPLQFSVSF